MDFTARYQDGDYLARNDDWHEEDAAWKAGHVRDLIRDAGLQPRRIADAGCGTGGVLVQLQAMLPPASELTGFEIAEPAFRIAATRGNALLRFDQSSVLDYGGEPFDLLIACDVFEHVPDYLGFLTGLRDKARHFIFHVPLDLSVKSLLTGLPMHRRATVGHLHYFNSATARATLADCGYRVREARLTHAILQPPPRGWRQKLRRLPDRALYRANPDLCATLLGGCSWLVLAEAG